MKKREKEFILDLIKSLENLAVSCIYTIDKDNTEIGSGSVSISFPLKCLTSHAMLEAWLNRKKDQMMLM